MCKSRIATPDRPNKYRLARRASLVASCIFAALAISSKAGAETKLPAAILVADLVPPGSEGTDRLTAFDQDPRVGAADLDQQRGGFAMPHGVTVRFGFEIQQFANHVMHNDLKVSPIEVANGVVQNHFTVSQTTPVAGGGTQTQTTILTQLPTGGFNAQATLNNGQTNLAVTLNNGSIETLVQNQANNQALQTISTVNLTTEGVAPLIHAAIAAARLIQTIHGNSWLQH
jgi:hypothetical protein